MKGTKEISLNPLHYRPTACLHYRYPESINLPSLAPSVDPEFLIQIMMGENSAHMGSIWIGAHDLIIDGPLVVFVSFY